jgi:ABC-type branched-subunit amino acid transport system ATPase component
MVEYNKVGHLSQQSLARHMGVQPYAAEESEGNEESAKTLETVSVVRARSKHAKSLHQQVLTWQMPLLEPVR